MQHLNVNYLFIYSFTIIGNSHYYQNQTNESKLNFHIWYIRWHDSLALLLARFEVRKVIYNLLVVVSSIKILSIDKTHLYMYLLRSYLLACEIIH
jgi:hypothetical protein